MYMIKDLYPAHINNSYNSILRKKQRNLSFLWSFNAPFLLISPFQFKITCYPWQTSQKPHWSNLLLFHPASRFPQASPTRTYPKHLVLLFWLLAPREAAAGRPLLPSFQTWVKADASCANTLVCADLRSSSLIPVPAPVNASFPSGPPTPAGPQGPRAFAAVCPNIRTSGANRPSADPTVPPPTSCGVWGLSFDLSEPPSAPWYVGTTPTRRGGVAPTGRHNPAVSAPPSRQAAPLSPPPPVPVAARGVPSRSLTLQRGSFSRGRGHGEEQRRQWPERAEGGAARSFRSSSRRDGSGSTRRRGRELARGSARSWAARRGGALRPEKLQPPTRMRSAPAARSPTYRPTAAPPASAASCRLGEHTAAVQSPRPAPGAAQPAPQPGPRRRRHRRFTPPGHPARPICVTLDPTPWRMRPPPGFLLAEGRGAEGPQWRIQGGWAGRSRGPAILRVVDGAQVLALPPGAGPSSELQLRLSAVPFPRSTRFPSICPAPQGAGRFPVARSFASWHQPGKRWRGGALRASPGKSFPCPV